MAKRRICSRCREVVEGKCGNCHRPQVDSRESAHQRGYNRRWRGASKGFLAKNRWCVECLAADRKTLAQVTDHIVPHRGDMLLFWNRDNWQPLCKKCHDRKTGSGQ